MDITTKATDMELTPELSDYIDKRLTVFNKFIAADDTSVLCQVEVERTTRHHEKGKVFRAEVNLHTRHGDYRADHTAETINEAIDHVQKQS